MFLRKLTVILVPLCMLLLLCLLMPLLFSLDWYFGALFIGLLLGTLLSLLLPLSGATRMREPFSCISIWLPSAPEIRFRCSACWWSPPDPLAPGSSPSNRPLPPTSWPSPSAPEEESEPEHHAV